MDKSVGISNLFIFIREILSGKIHTCQRMPIHAIRLEASSTALPSGGIQFRGFSHHQGTKYVSISFKQPQATAF